MKATRPLFAFAGSALFLLSGCVTQPPEMSGVPTISPLPQRIPPPNESIVVEIAFPVIATEPDALAETVTYRRGFSAPESASVVISVPIGDEDFGPVPDPVVEPTALNFRTTGYFNIMEQQIEKQLLRRGFTVLDRAKFEAILRDQREDPAGPPAREPEAPSYRGYKRQLTDVSELIRAADSPELQADFIFQVNDFVTEPSQDDVINLAGRSEFIEATARNPGMGRALSESGFTEMIKPGFFSALNAKLIRVDDGSIEWVGSHRVDTQNAQPFTLKLPFVKSASNVDAINDGIDEWNDSLRAKLNQVRALKQEAERLFEQKAGKDKIEAAVADFEAAREELETMKNRLPDAWDADWKFLYELATAPAIEPLLPSANKMVEIENQYREAETETERIDAIAEARRMQDLISQHVAQLSQLVAEELIAQIP